MSFFFQWTLRLVSLQKFEQKKTSIAWQLWSVVYGWVNQLPVWNTCHVTCADRSFWPIIVGYVVVDDLFVAFFKLWAGLSHLVSSLETTPTLQAAKTTVSTGHFTWVWCLSRIKRTCEERQLPCQALEATKLPMAIFFSTQVCSSIVSDLAGIIVWKFQLCPLCLEVFNFQHQWKKSPTKTGPNPFLVFR